MDSEIRQLDQAKFLYYLSRRDRISTRHLLRLTGLPQAFLYQLLKKHADLLAPPSRYLSVKADLRQQILSDSLEKINLIKNSNLSSLKSNLYSVLSLRPSPDRTLDQFYATRATTFRRAKKLAQMGDIYQRHLAFLGDDDFTSIAVALTRQAASITLFEIDDRLTEIIEKFSTENNLNIQVVKHDLKKAFDPKYLHRFDTVFTDPPYTPDGITLFLNRAVDLLNPKLTSRLYLCYGNSDRARERELVIQKIISDFGFLLHSKYFHFNFYQSAQSIGSRSSLYLLDWTPQLKNRHLSSAKIYTHE